LLWVMDRITGEATKIPLPTMRFRVNALGSGTIR
jgi:hypothetical protein